MKSRILIAAVLLAAVLVEEKLPVEGFFHVENGKRVEDWDHVSKGSTHFIADERWYYYDRNEVPGVDRGTMDVYSEIGKYLEPFFQNLPMTVAIPGAMNMVAYYANYATAIVEFGLTDSAIAHSSLSIRGHIGHEKKAGNEYFERRHVDIELGEFVSSVPEHLALNEIAFEIPTIGVWQLGRVITYDRPLMDTLAERLNAVGNKSIIPRFEGLIPYYVRNLLPNRPLNLLEEDYGIFQKLYFSRYPDTALERPFEERIAELKKEAGK